MSKVDSTGGKIKGQDLILLVFDANSGVKKKWEGRLYINRNKVVNLKQIRQ